MDDPKALAARLLGVTVRDGDDSWHLECRFADDGQKFAAVEVAKDAPGAESIAHNIAHMLLAGRNAADALDRLPAPDGATASWDNSLAEANEKVADLEAKLAKETGFGEAAMRRIQTLLGNLTEARTVAAQNAARAKESDEIADNARRNLVDADEKIAALESRLAKSEDGAAYMSAQCAAKSARAEAAERALADATKRNADLEISVERARGMLDVRGGASGAAEELAFVMSPRALLTPATDKGEG